MTEPSVFESLLLLFFHSPWYIRGGICGAVGLLFFSQVVERVVYLPLRPLDKRIDELKVKAAEAKIQLVSAGKDAENDNPFETMLAETKESYRRRLEDCRRTEFITGAVLWLIGLVLTFAG